MLLDSSDLDWLAGLARALLRGAPGADDLVQETVLAALEGSPPPEAPRRAWLASVARRLAARRFRSDSRRQRREERAAQPESLPDSAELVARAEAAERLTAAVQRLREPFRRTILLRYLEGLSSEEIARREEKPADTVRWRVRRGLELLREELDASAGSDSAPGSWVPLLVPLANSSLDAGRATAAAAKWLPGPVAVGVSMSTTQWIAAVVIVALLGGWVWWWQSGGADGGAERGAEVATREDSVSENAGSSGNDVNVETSLPFAPRAETPRIDAAAKPAEERSAVGEQPVPFGVVVDEDGSPVPGATVFVLFAASTEAAGSTEPFDLVESDARGEFFLTPPEDAAFDLGVVANGFLSRTVSDLFVPSPVDNGDEAAASGSENAPVKDAEVGRSAPDGEAVSDAPLRVVLERGLTLVGQVIDTEGRPVAGLRLLAHTPGRATIDHVSPSQMSLRGDRATLKHASTRYQQCRARTDAQGWVEFSGLPDEELTVRALDPGWKLEEQIVRPGDDVVWLAKERLGVQLTVIDAVSGERVDRARAIFRMRLRFADGEAKTLEQWVGRGVGEVSFAVDPTTQFPQEFRNRTITRVEFYGEVESGGATTSWEAAPYEDPSGVAGVVAARVTIDAGGERVEGVAPGDSEDAYPTDDAYSVVVLRARYPDQAPVRGRVVVRWRSANEGEVTRQGVARVDPSRWGDYEFDVLPGTVSLEVYEFGASGSLPNATLELRCDRFKTQIADVELPRGGSVSIARPQGWSGAWYTHASWRPVGDNGDWRGSWNYGTEEETHELSALRPAEWRFQLRQRPDDPDPIVHTVVVREGRVESVGD